MKKHLILGLLLAFVMVPAPAFAACVLPPGDLSYGSQETSVTHLQEFLRGKGHLSAAPTGYFGTATAEAVKKFQLSQGIDSTGYVGPYTRARLRILTCEGATGANTPAGITFISPAGGEKYVAGQKTKIMWEGSTPGVDQISLHLISNMLGAHEVVKTIGTTRAKRGYYTWKVPSRLTSYGGPGAGYSIEMRGKAFSTESAGFTIAEGDSVKELPVITGTNGPALDNLEAYIGKTLNIEGKNFLKGPTDSTVYFAGKEVVLSQQASDDRLQINVPDVRTGTQSLYVVTSEGKSNVVRIKVYDPEGTLEKPEITMAVGKAADDFEGDANVSLSIYGSHFTSTSKVYLGSDKISLLQTPDIEGDRLVIMIPSLQTGYYNLYVQTEAGKSNTVQVWINGKG